MDLRYDAQQGMLRDATRGFLESVCPVARTRALFDDPLGFDPDIWLAGARLGWCAPVVPEEYGGGSVSGQGIIDLVAIAEEMGRFVYPGPFIGSNVVALAVAELGSNEQREQVLPGITSGEEIAAWCYAEASGDWDPHAVRLEARADGDDIILNGAKSYVDGAHAATWLLVAARRGGELIQLVLPAETRGVSISPLETLDPTRRLAAVTFEDVRVPAESVLGDHAGTPAAIERQMQTTLVLLCADSVGAADRVLDMTVAYAKDRIQFGVPIGRFQAVKHKAATMLLWLEASRAATYYAALGVQASLDDAPLSVAAMASYVGEGTAALAADGLQIHGGIGFTWEHDIHLYLRRTKSNELLFGDPAWHRERLVRIVGV